ncbi:hypothetical protein XU18_4931 [Perkinsela sp. CCAP 1560/4]|nr:hypothetical protein XU18_4931 [Perkinsela sp. CCAP 1560/4]|eukprot:KNH03736.1 hypothetical protein XU18_4931 [Perkinsela sp. CCAP 1560/4]
MVFNSSVFTEFHLCAGGFFICSHNVIWNFDRSTPKRWPSIGSVQSLLHLTLCPPILRGRNANATVPISSLQRLLKHVDLPTSVAGHASPFADHRWIQTAIYVFGFIQYTNIGISKRICWGSIELSYPSTPVSGKPTQLRAARKALDKTNSNRCMMHSNNKTTQTIHGNICFAF